jgi:hypothetical protein
MQQLTLSVVIIAGLVTVFPVSVQAKDAAVANPYPLKKCVVSGEDLDSDGKTPSLVFKQEMKFCCKGCVRDFKKDPLKYVARIHAAQLASAKTDKKMDKGSTNKGSDHKGHDH